MSKLRTFDLAAYRLGFVGNRLAKYERVLEFDAPDAKDLPGLEHELQPGCSHCDLKRDAAKRHMINFRSGHAFMRWLLTDNAPGGFVEGMVSCLQDDPLSETVVLEN